MVDWKYVVGRAYLSETAGRYALLKSILIVQFVRFGFGFFADIGGSDRTAITIRVGFRCAARPSRV
jgi:hypothetical protein